MRLAKQLAAPRVRWAVAAGACVLSLGGLVLARAELPATKPTVAAPLPAVGGSPFSGPGVSGTIALSQTSLASAGSHELFAEITAAGVAGDTTGHVRAPISLAIAIDTSGSMQGDKIADARRAVARLIREMQPTDELAVVRYSSDAETIQTLAKVGDVRETLIAKIQNLNADGGTAIPLGLAEAEKALGVVNKGRVRRIVLVSDGLDGTRTQAERIADRNFERGITLSSLGIGSDFDEAYMNGVATHGHGNFAFVKNSDTLATFLHRELDEAASTTADDVRVRVELPAGISLVRAHGADVDTKDGLTVRLGSLFAGDERRVILELKVEGAQTARFISGNASWTPVGGSVGAARAETPLPRLELQSVPDAVAARATRNAAVLASVVSVQSSARQMAAAEAYAHGDTKTATSLAERNIAEIAEAKRTAPALFSARSYFSRSPLASR